MRVNVDRVLERDQKLTELDNRAGITCPCYLLIDFMPACVLYSYLVLFTAFLLPYNVVILKTVLFHLSYVRHSARLTRLIVAK